MKRLNVLTVVLLCLALCLPNMAYATKKPTGKPHGNSGSNATSSSRSFSAAKSSSRVRVGVDNNNHGGTANIGETSNANQSSARGGESNSASNQVANLETEYEAVASSAASIVLSECTDGGSAQTESIGASVGQRNYPCEVFTEIQISLMFIKADIDSAKIKSSAEYKHIDDDDNTTPQEHIDRAHDMLDNIYERVKKDGDLDDYMDTRSWTAPVGAAARDVAIPIGLILLLIAL